MTEIVIHIESINMYRVRCPRCGEVLESSINGYKNLLKIYSCYACELEFRVGSDRIKKSKSKDENKKVRKLTDEQLKNEILDFISLTGKADIENLMGATGVSGRILIDCCKSLVYDKRLIKSGRVYKLGK
jgi:DNA-directed RNA polymerase subunit M/transcription elongation factor TFIIS